MSLHAELSSEARNRYEAQQRSSRLLSVVISLLAVTLLTVILALLFLELPAKPEASVRIISGPLPEELQVVERTVSIFKKPTPAPGGATSRVLVTINRSELSIPVPDTPIPTESEPFGDGTGIGDGIGDHFGPPGGPNLILSPPLRKRCSRQDRLARVKESGGSEKIEDAVVKSLRWLKQTQNKDGSWGSGHAVGMTGLALLAYLGHCETPVSDEFGESCTDAIAYLLNVSARNKGKMATNLQDRHWPYEHAIATYALAEALSFGKAFNYNIPNHHNTVQAAGQWIIDNQHQSGGWDYAYEEASTRGGDLSVVGWQLQALKACKATGVDYRNLTGCVRKALDYVEGRQAASGGFGYTGTTPVGSVSTHSLTGVGSLSFQIWGKGSHPAARKGVRYIRTQAVLDYNGSQSDLYAHYYHSQALMQHGGEAWTKYNDSFAPQLLNAQGADGSFAKPGGGNAPDAAAALFAQDNPEGILYRNCLCTLMLEVYYRYLPGTS